MLESGIIVLVGYKISNEKFVKLIDQCTRSR